jgi:hypothetical protein
MPSDGRNSTEAGPGQRRAQRHRRHVQVVQPRSERCARVSGRERPALVGLRRARADRHGTRIASTSVARVRSRRPRWCRGRCASLPVLLGARSGQKPRANWPSRSPRRRRPPPRTAAKEGVRCRTRRHLLRCGRRAPAPGRSRSRRGLSLRARRTAPGRRRTPGPSWGCVAQGGRAGCEADVSSCSLRPLQPSKGIARGGRAKAESRAR